MGKERIPAIGKRRVEQLMDRSVDIEDVIVVVGFSPVVFTPVSEFKGKSSIFRKGPFGLDIGSIKEELLQVVDDVGSNMPRGVAKFPGGVEFGHGAAKLSMADKHVGIEIEGDIRQEGLFGGIKSLEYPGAEKVFMHIAIFNTEDVVIVGRSCRSRQASIPEIRLEGVFE